MIMMQSTEGTPTIVIGIIESDIQIIKSGRTLTWEDAGIEFKGRNIIIFYGKTKADLVEQLEAAGVKVSEEWRDLYNKDVRTDGKRS